jgi:hypothetical protein
VPSFALEVRNPCWRTDVTLLPLSSRPSTCCLTPEPLGFTKSVRPKRCVLRSSQALPHAGTAEPVRVAPPEAAVYPMEIRPWMMSMSISSYFGMIKGRGIPGFSILM